LVYTYTVNATSPCTTAATATVTLTQQALPNAGTNGALTVCAGTTPTNAQLFASLGGTPTTGGTWTNLGLVYTYTVAPTSPCTTAPATATVTLTEQAQPNAGTNGTLTVCAGTTPTNSQLFASLGGTPTTGGTWANIGLVYTYTVAPTSPCATAATATVTLSEQALPIALITGSLSICSGETTTLTASGGTSYLWSNNLGTNAVTTTISSAGTYSVTVTGLNSCTNTVSAIVMVNSNIVPSFTQISNYCSGATIPNLLTTSSNGITGTWSPAINNTATTTYTFTPSTGLCATIQTMSITITPNITPLFTQVVSYCSGATIPQLAISSTNGISGSWSPAINNTATTTYTFTPTAGQCATTQTMSITIATIITSTNFVDLCDSEVPLFWNGNSYNETGIYTYNTVTAGGCDSIAILDLTINPNPIASFTPSLTSFTESPQAIALTNTSFGAVNYTWDFGDGSYSTDENPSHIFADNSNGQIITLFAESSEGCIGSYQITIELEEELIYYVPNTFTPDGDGYNQTFKPVFTSGFDPYNYEMLIFNRWGEIIFETHDVTYGWDGTYALENCQDGVYLYKITFKNPFLDEPKVVCGSVSLLK
jgi:gliding motility-associated-like protein